MDRYVFSCSSSDVPKRLKRSSWKRSVAETEGRLSAKYRRDASASMLQSYGEVGAFPHLYHNDGERCLTHMKRLAIVAGLDRQDPFKREGISGLEFDNQGIYLASVTKSGCLMVHDFEALYCLCNDPFGKDLLDEERKHLLHISTRQQLDVVRWNRANQDEVACTSMLGNEVQIFDIGRISSLPVAVLRKRPTVTVHGFEVPRGLTDIAFISSDKSRLLASDMFGVINIWDRRVRNVPCVELVSNSNSAINSIQIDAENQIVFGASKHGIIYAWDLRGGRTSLAFQSNKEMNHSPLTSLKLASAMEKIESLKVQTDIFPREIHSINLDPSNPYQVAFHLDDGWSGVLNINTCQVTHIHCPPPAWLNEIGTFVAYSTLRKASWLPTGSIYAVGSSVDNGLHLLDFYPDARSACHVDNESKLSIYKEKHQSVQNRFIPSSETITVCASHPLNGTIVAGTKQYSLLVFSQSRYSYPAEQ